MKLPNRIIEALFQSEMLANTCTCSNLGFLGAIERFRSKFLCEPLSSMAFTTFITYFIPRFGKYSTLPVLIVALVSCVSIQAQDLSVPQDTSIITEHSLSINGKNYNYTAETGFQPLWNDTGKVIASLHYTYYSLDNDDSNERPLLISFNGGPGSASVWMHIAYTGPVLLQVDDEGFPIQPYGLKKNHHSILDVADVLYVNPVNTGYSRIVDKDIDAKKEFFGVNADIKYLASWLSTFVQRHNRWLSPKFLIGESYGTVRVSGLALELQNAEWMYLNGVVLVSPTDLGIERDGPVAIANRLPYYAVTAWYHGHLNEELQALSLDELTQMVEKFTIEELTPALHYGSELDSSRKNEIISKMAMFSGLSEREIRDHNLDVPKSYFWKALERRKGGFTVGRLDSRYRGIDKKLAGTSPDYNAELSSWLHAFTPSINWYFRNELNLKTDLKYKMFGDVHPWNRENNKTGENLRQAMATNPFMHVLIQSGYYDGATTYFDAKYTQRHLDPSGRMNDRIMYEAYESGHMMYLRTEDLSKSTEDLREFIREAIPEEAGKY